MIDRIFTPALAFCVLIGAAFAIGSAWFDSRSLSGAITTGANLKHVTWSNTICPDGTNSNSHSSTCVGHL